MSLNLSLKSRSMIKKNSQKMFFRIFWTKIIKKRIFGQRIQKNWAVISSFELERWLMALIFFTYTTLKDLTKIFRKKRFARKSLRNVFSIKKLKKCAGDYCCKLVCWLMALNFTLTNSAFMTRNTRLAPKPIKTTLGYCLARKPSKIPSDYYLAPKDSWHLGYIRVVAWFFFALWIVWVKSMILFPL